MNSINQEDRLPGEEWADISGLGGLCEVSTLGRCRTVPRALGKKDNQGNLTTAHYGGRYLKVEMVTGRFYVTPRVDGKLKKIRLPEAIMEAFRGETSEGRKVAFLNGDSGDLRLENLGWQGKKTKPERELSEQQIEIISRCALSEQDLAILMDMSASSIQEIRSLSRQQAEKVGA
ncbi:hypothetical protein KDX38_10930 [Pseudomonas sp. CDFA 602]|uniref:hypothetical protein n=1 Tax=Pseudomonas californiensis TaxID=2829823 RepID=UPI001E2E2DFA|nr:hypothetical protein [Pseudomonas californiensis]MCD5994169.1 hypothetical protein [Pseudomonas californiensis]MCD5999732.1 hypothetical protein [Pseudomonas californiensis]